jgi:hypothetical protein
MYVCILRLCNAQSIEFIVSVSTVALSLSRSGSTRNLEHLETFRRNKANWTTGCEWPADAGLLRVAASVRPVLFSDVTKWTCCIRDMHICGYAGVCVSVVVCRRGCTPVHHLLCTLCLLPDHCRNFLQSDEDVHRFHLLPHSLFDTVFGLRMYFVILLAHQRQYVYHAFGAFEFTSCKIKKDLWFIWCLICLYCRQVCTFLISKNYFQPQLSYIPVLYFIFKALLLVKCCQLCY